MKSYTYMKLRTPQNLKPEINNIIYELERDGRSISKNPNAVQSLSRQLRIPKSYGDIIFAKDRYKQRTVIMIHPKKKLVKLGPRIKFIDK